MEGADDPRWNRRPQQEQGGGGAEGPADPRWNTDRPVSGRAAVLRRDIPREPSFNRNVDGSGSSYNIVFSPSWVKITTPIGEGAFSRVFEGVYTNPDTGEKSVVAVKILKRDMLKRRSDCLRFIKEAKIMTKICHKNIAACLGIGKYDDEDEANPGSLFIVQELIKGGNLLHKVYKQMLNRHKYVYTSTEALKWMVNVAEGMQYLHSVSENKPMIIHRDLKLENIMLVHEGSAMCKLVDFGLHKVIDDRLQKVVKRVVSEAQLGGGLSRGGLRKAPLKPPGEDEDDELEVALAEQRAKMEVGGGARTRPESFSPTASSRFAREQSCQSLPITEEGEEGEDAGEEGEESKDTVAAPAVEKAPASTTKFHQVPQSKPSPLGQPVADSESHGEPNSGPEPVMRLRRAPQRTTSMQKLMAKIKEIKLKVVSKLGDGPVSGEAAEGIEEVEEAEPVPKVADPPAPPDAAPSEKMPVSATQKIAANHQLLDKYIAQQSTARGETSSTVLDDLGIIDGGARQQGKRAPPRRAVTWVNEIRYNLTEAVGSWAYMAPEVVMGQPYNEKVDIFSFGVILFEVLHRKLMLVDEIKNDPRKDAQAYAERVSRGFRPEIPKHWPRELADIIQASWAQDPHMRPNFTAILDVLRELESSGQVGKLDVAYWGANSAFV